MYPLFMLYLVAALAATSFSDSAPPAPALAPAGPTSLTTVLRETPDERGRLLRCQPGPWGRLEYVNTQIEAPAQLLASEPPAEQVTRWRLPGVAPSNLPPLLAWAGLDADLSARLQALASWDATGAVLNLTPSDAFVLGLAPEQRNRLYGLLGRFAGNATLRHPYRFETRTPTAWFADTDLEPGTRETLERLMYRRGGLSLFSDVGPALRVTADPEERRRLMKTLYRQPTLLVRIRVEPDDPLEPVIAYWGERRREDEVAPLLESVQGSDVSWTLNVALLLPTWPRQMLMKYDLGTRGSFRDCHWTSMNFFLEEPDDRFLDAAYTRDTILRDYARVRDNFRLGDLILLRDARSEVVHSCNYLADNIVFTKNGGEAATPWTLMTLEDLVEYYSMGEPLDVVVLRRTD